VVGVTEQHPVELIMARGLVSNLTTAAFLVDAEGVLVFFNERAAELLGVKYEEAGPMAPEEWGGRFAPTTLDDRPLPVEQLPLAIALQGRPAHAPMRIRSGSGTPVDIDVTAFPLEGQAGQSGALAIFWEREGG
jgi:PAS domain-containing protein